MHIDIYLKNYVLKTIENLEIGVKSVNKRVRIFIYQKVYLSKTCRELGH